MITSPINDAILMRPDVRAALRTWFEETKAFERGVSSAVVADLLEECGWVDDARNTFLDGLAISCTFLGWCRGPGADALTTTHWHNKRFFDAIEGI